MIGPVPRPPPPPGGQPLLPDAVCCRRREAPPPGPGLERALQLPQRAHPGRAASPGAAPWGGGGRSLAGLTLGVPARDQALVEKLLSRTADASLLISRFQEFLEMDDVRYYVMSSVRENLARVMGRSGGVGLTPSPPPGSLTPQRSDAPVPRPLSPGRPARVPEQRLHAHLQHQRPQAGV